MKRSGIYSLAARIVDWHNCSACMAIHLAAGVSARGTRTKLLNSLQARAMFAVLMDKASKDSLWFGPLTEENKNRRVLALLFAALEAEDRNG